ncbi:transmembrane protein 14 homolog [Culicoides brevitarsis]|uniref:transmembrane protein 14 homolog n=1 Tax=Culicoides brevitarsis TaxID=469753 RepID=UPI00307C7C67
MATDLLGYAYAATVAAGGVMGYAKAGSIPSLAAGLTFGVILGVGAYYTSQSPPKPLLQLGTAAVLGGVMGMRFARSGKLMPAGLIAGISAAMLIRGLVVYQRYLPIVGKN